MNKKGLIIAGTAVLLIAAGVIVLSQNNTPQNINGPAPSANVNQDADTTRPQPESNNDATQQDPKQNENTIVYSDDGFGQKSLTVKAGSIVSIRNNSSRILQFDSDPHPQHTDNPELNIGNISPGHQRSVTVTKTGSHGFHNHANDDHTGTLVVE